MAGNNLKQICEFDLHASVADTDKFILQTALGVTKNTTKSALLNDTNTSLVGLQTQIDTINDSGSTVTYHVIIILVNNSIIIVIGILYIISEYHSQHMIGI